MTTPLEPLTLVLEFSREEQAGDPLGFQFASQEYLLRGTGGRFDSARFPWSEELLADLAVLRQPDGAPEAVQRIGETLRRFLHAAGWAEEEQVREAVSQGRRVLLTIRSAAAELYAIPWELTALKATGQHLGELPEVLLRYEWPETQTAPAVPTPRTERGRILFAWSAAGGPVPAAEHLAALVHASQHGHFAFEPDRDVLASVSAESLSRRLEQAAAAGTPVAALHILCQCTAQGPTLGLAWDGSAGGSVIDGAALRRLLEPHKGQLRLVVLCACDRGSSGQLGNQLGSISQQLHRIGIEAVVGSRFPLSASGSVRLTASLYETLLAEPASLESALLAARRALSTQPGPDWASLQLYSRAADGNDTRPIVFRPFRGLLAYQPEHQRFLFGRDAQIGEALADLAALRQQGKPRFLIVAGASGTGKSSLVLAGVAPRLLAQSGWRLARIRVSGDPMAALESALSAGTGSVAQLLLIVDQFEELFTQVDTPAHRQRFIERLWQLASDPAGQVTVVATLRVDFIGQCGELAVDGGRRQLDQVAYDEAHRVFIAQLDREQLRSTILGPVQCVGLELESGLVERIIEDVAGEPGALPLIADTLDLLWQRRAGRLLTQAAYDALGGVTGALRQRADALIDGLDASSQRLARRLLVRLVSITEDMSTGTRRRLPLATARPADPTEAGRFDHMVEALVAARLLVREGGADAPGQLLEVAHEALIRRWERLASWVLADRKMLAELEKLAAWVVQRSEHGTLLDDNQLGYATLVKSRYPEDLPPGAHELIAASREAANRRRRTRQGTILALAVLAVSALAFGWYGVDGRRRAERAAQTERDARRSEEKAKAELHQKLLATYIEQGRQLLVERGDAVRALLWFNRAYQGGSTSAALRFLLAQTLYELDALLLTIPGGVRATLGDATELRLGELPAFSPDGNRLLTSDGKSGSAQLWDAQLLKLRAELGGHRAPLTAMTFSTSGRHIATASSDGIVKLWNTAAATERASFTAGSEITALAFNKDSSLLAVALPQGVELWDVETQQRQWSWSIPDADDDFATYQAVAFSADGTRLIGTGLSIASAWTVKRGTLAWMLRPPTFSGEHFRAVYGAASDHVLALLRREEDPLFPVLFQGETGEKVGELLGASNPMDAAFNSLGTRLLIASWDPGVSVWNPRSQDRVVEVRGDAELYAVTFHPDGKNFAGVGPTGARIWASDSGRLIQSMVAPSGRLAGVAFGKGANRLMTAAQDGKVRLWDSTRNARGLGAVGSPAVRERLLAALKYPYGASDAPPLPGKPWLKTVDSGVVEVHGPGGELLWRLEPGGAATRTALSADGSLAVTWAAAYPASTGDPAGGVASVRIWAVESGLLLYELTEDAALLFAAAMDGVGADGQPTTQLPAELLRRPPAPQELDTFIRSRLPLHFSGESLVANEP